MLKKTATHKPQLRNGMLAIAGRMPKPVNYNAFTTASDFSTWSVGEM